MYELIATDIDGTLLDRNSELPAFNKQALLDCMEAGIKVILATGKTIDAIYHIVRELDLSVPQITQNGAVTVGRDRKIIRSMLIGQENYFELIGAIKQKGYSPIVCLENGKIFFDNYHPNMEHLIAVGQKLVKTNSIEKEYFSRQAASITIPIKETDPLDSYIRKQFGGILQVVRSGEYYFDILNKGATKGSALKAVLKMLNIDRSRTAVFGDSYNDLSMFDTAGLRIAVENSYPPVLESADIITEDNNNCGLAKAIYKYILK